MTISLLHFNPSTGTSASITATGGPAVGGYVNHSWRSLGGCATQGLFTNPWYADFVQQQLMDGQNAVQIVDKLIALDSDHDKRQCLVIDKQGQSAALNGGDNIPYIGSLAFDSVAVAGNMLENAEVMTEFASAFLASTTNNGTAVLSKGERPIYKPDYETFLPESLITALEAALNAGGDKRGTVSASLRVEYTDKAPIDIRVDWAKDNLIEELKFVLGKVRESSFQAFLDGVPNRIDI
ncbi:Bll2871 protein [Vibrio variabilis]|uniref:Bll2871 protein n=1 Tax=Vibrio variabilis TaxID=990271 RepID=A0ABQ0JH85_9VIBR|nr:Bll2871 protein [Vibrio variabilis]